MITTTDDYEPAYEDGDPDARLAPNDLEAEQALIGALQLAQPRDQRRIHQMLTAGDFYRPAHTTIWQAAEPLLDQGEIVTPITLTAQLQARGDLARIGGAPYLHTCVAACPVVALAEQLADRIRSLALRRALISVGMEIARIGYDPTAGAPEDLAEHAVALAREVRDAGRAAADSPVEDMIDFLQHEDTYDWIVPGLLERMDRLMLTGGEGGGKSTLLRQMAVTVAAGLHPFQHTPNPLGPARVLVLDCENSAPQSRRRYRHLLNLASAHHMPVKRGQLHIDVRPEGVDLTRAEGRSWLMRRVETVMPDVLVIGPVYQLHTGDPNSEEQARRVTLALTEARLTARCAVLMEAHAAKGTGFGPRGLSPAGSSLWLRWPEFGYGLRAVEDERSAEEDRARRLVPWRGARDDRQWPPFLRQGWMGPHPWPWAVYRPIDSDQFTGRSATGATS